MKLHLGGETPHPDFSIVNAADLPGVDYQQDASDLSNFETESIEVIYASHILEHFHYLLDDELNRVLGEWWRVLEPRGKLYVSVPDLDELCLMFLKLLLPAERRHIMRIMYGGQTSQFDVHKVGFNEDILRQYLARFATVQRVHSFGIFNDCSELELWGHRISLNMIATK